MYKALQEGRIIAVSDTDSVFNLLVKDAVASDPEHVADDYIFSFEDRQYVLKTDDRAKAELRKERIAELKQLLANHDYWTSKHADGEYTDEEWAEKVAQRKAWRDELRELENESVAG